MPMHHPSHHCGIVRHERLEPPGLPVTTAARHVRVSRQLVSELVNDGAAVSVDKAIRPTKTLGSPTEQSLSGGLEGIVSRVVDERAIANHGPANRSPFVQ